MAKEKTQEKKKVSSILSASYGKFDHKKITPLERSKRKLEKKRRKKQQTEAQNQARSGNFPFETIHGFKLVETEYNIPPMAERKKKRKAFSNIRSEFLQHVGKEHEDKLRGMGMSQKEIDLVKEGKTPSGYNTHHKLPIHGGGKNEFSNFIIMPIPPHDDLHHVVIDQQIKGMSGGSKTIKLPWTDDMVFVPPENKNDYVPEKDYEAKHGKNYRTGARKLRVHSENKSQGSKDQESVAKFKAALRATKTR